LTECRALLRECRALLREFVTDSQLNLFRY